MDENEKLVEDLLELTAHPKWEVFVEQATIRMEQIKESALFVESFEELKQLRGEYETLSRLANTREVMKQIRDHYNEEQTENEGL